MIKIGQLVCIAKYYHGDAINLHDERGEEIVQVVKYTRHHPPMMYLGICSSSCLDRSSTCLDEYFNCSEGLIEHKFLHEDRVLIGRIDYKEKLTHYLEPWPGPERNK
jgi:hypothetical protein